MNIKQAKHIKDSLLGFKNWDITIHDKYLSGFYHIVLSKFKGSLTDSQLQELLICKPLLVDIEIKIDNDLCLIIDIS